MRAGYSFTQQRSVPQSIENEIRFGVILNFKLPIRGKISRLLTIISIISD